MNTDTENNSKESREYEDDFENDLELLLSRTEKILASAREIPCSNSNTRTTDRALEENTTKLPSGLSDSVSPRRNSFISVPSSQPVDPISDSESDHSVQEPKLAIPKDPGEDSDEELRRYIMEKILEINKLLQSQPLDHNGEPRLQAKDQVTDLNDLPSEGTGAQKCHSDPESHTLKNLSPSRLSNELGHEGEVVLSLDEGAGEANKDGKVLVERDGKFELVNLQDIESQKVAPSTTNGLDAAENVPQQVSNTPSPLPANCALKEKHSAKMPAMANSPSGEPQSQAPAAPGNLKPRPSSAAIPRPSQRNLSRASSRPLTAQVSPVTKASRGSPGLKELQSRSEQKSGRLKKEESRAKRKLGREGKMQGIPDQQEQPREGEGMKDKKRENDLVFKAWLQKKREQVLETRRIALERAKQIEEDLNSKQEGRDPERAFQLWLKKKHEEQLKEKRVEELRRQQECLCFLRETEGRKGAFKQWLRRKQIEKLAEQQMIRERFRLLRLEAKRSKQCQSNLYIPELQAFRFTDYHK